MKKITICFLLLLGITGCGRSKEATLNVLNWSSYIPDSIIEDFEKETGIIVNYSTYSSNEELLAKISSAKEGTYDLIFPSDYMIELMINRNLLEPLDKSKLKNINNLKKEYLNLDYDINNTYSLPFLATTTVIAVNRDHIKDNITSYNDLLNPNYKNNIVLLDDQRIVIGMANQALGYSMNTTNDQELKKAEEFLLDLKKNVKAYDSDSPKTLLITNEVDIGVMWNAEAALALQENPNIEIIFPKENGALSIDNYAIVKGAKHKDNVYKFIDYILRPEVMKQIIEEYPYINVNDKTEKLLSNEYLANKAANIPDYIIKQAEMVQNIGSNIYKYDKLWALIK